MICRATSAFQHHKLRSSAPKQSVLAMNTEGIFLAYIYIGLTLRAKHCCDRGMKFGAQDFPEPPITRKSTRSLKTQNCQERLNEKMWKISITATNHVMVVRASLIREKIREASSRLGAPWLDDEFSCEYAFFRSRSFFPNKRSVDTYKSCKVLTFGQRKSRLNQLNLRFHGMDFFVQFLLFLNLFDVVDENFDRGVSINYQLFG